MASLQIAGDRHAVEEPRSSQIAKDVLDLQHTLRNMLLKNRRVCCRLRTSLAIWLQRRFFNSMSSSCNLKDLNPTEDPAVPSDVLETQAARLPLGAEPRRRSGNSPSRISRSSAPRRSCAV